MECQVVLSPDLDITPAEFAAQWNEMEESRAAAEARVVEGESMTRSFGPDLTTIILSFVVSVAASLSSKALAGLCRQVLDKYFKKRGVTKQIKIIQSEQPDGTKVIAVTIDEG